jgi:mono/diheme cytochrome c family protein
MSRSRIWSLLMVPAVVLLAGALPPAAHAQQRPDAAKGTAKPEAAADDKVARGQYIVEDVAMCGRCHSPVDMHGNRDRTHWLMGGAVGIAPTVATEAWAVMAPRIGGSPPGTDAQFVQLLMTGVSRTGYRLRQPMPQFRMTQGDAEAVLAYLKSLGSHGPIGTN